MAADPASDSSHESAGAAEAAYAPASSKPQLGSGRGISRLNRYPAGIARCRRGLLSDRSGGPLTPARPCAEHRRDADRAGRSAMEMQDRTVIVTGGASGIGRATALLLAREGARVFIGDINEAGGRTTAAQAASEGLAVEFLPLDLTQPDNITDFAAAVQARVELVDGLVNGAGWDRIQPFMENSPEMWDRLIAINLL